MLATCGPPNAFVVALLLHDIVAIIFKDSPERGRRSRRHLRNDRENGKNGPSTPEDDAFSSGSRRHDYRDDSPGKGPDDRYREGRGPLDEKEDERGGARSRSEGDHYGGGDSASSRSRRDFPQE